MKKLLVILCSLLLFSVTACKHKKQAVAEGKTDSTIVVDDDEKADGNFELVEGRCYCVIANHDTAFAFVDILNKSDVAGRYYLVEAGSECATLHKFSISIHRRSLRVNYDDAEKVFKIRSTILRDYIDGEWHLLNDGTPKGFRFKVEPYVETEFGAISDTRFRKEQFGVMVQKDVRYGAADGYWISMVGEEGKSYGHIVGEGLKNSFRRHKLPLDMDVYIPVDTGYSDLRPMIMFLHGGAFYVGDKSDPAISAWCKHFAAMGYVAVSANYRMGFIPSKREIERTGYMAVQDAHAAMRYLVTHADDYKIDTSRLFVAGASAGSITALNLVFMSNADRPKASFGKGKHKEDEDLGPIESSGNTLNAKFHIRGVANMWGAVYDLNILKNSRTDIVSFHGDADQLVPYGQGIPFSDISKRVGQTLFNPMYGSSLINEKAKDYGLRSRLYTFPGAGHALHLNEDRSINIHHFNYIRDSITAFFYGSMVPHKAQLGQDNYEARHYYVDSPDVKDVIWDVDGGFVLKSAGTDIWIVWKEDSQKRIVRATGHYKNGIGFYTKFEDKV